MIKSLFGYIKEHKWLYLSIALVLLLYDFTMLIPTQVIQRLVDHLSHHTLTQQNLIRDVGLFGDNLQLSVGLLLAFKNISVVY